MNPVHYQPEAGIAWITINYPPVNAMSVAVRDGLLGAVKAAEADNMSHGIICCEGRTFVAGGDISEFGRPPQQPHLPDVYNYLEASPVTWLAAMHGTVLGGGFELAMACDYRVALQNTRFGLPEVTLGLVPGAGGTQRSPRLLGVELAIDLTTSGRMINATDLLQAGGLDSIIEGELKAGAIEFLQNAGPAPQQVSQREIAPLTSDFFETKKQPVLKAAKGATAPLHNLEAIKWATETSFADGQKKERTLHLQLRNSEQSVALRHAFFAERAVSKPVIIKDTTAREFSNITIVGGGLMGAGISAACLNAGLNVHMIEVDKDAATAGKQRVIKLLDGALKRGKLSRSQYTRHCEALSAGTDYSAARETDIAIEAVVEDLEVKQGVFRSLAEHVPANTIIATNTSYLNPTEIAKGIKNPERILGLHFFSPAHIMKLLEIVNTPATSTEVLATAFAFAKKLRKVGALSGICDGFIGNRMLAAYRRQADYLLADGATPQQIDSAMRNFGLPMGPYELQDLTGLQIGWANRKRLAPTRDPAQRYISIADQLCELNRFGQRSGMGWYRYENGDRTPLPDPLVNDIISNWSAENNINRRNFSEKNIQQSLIAVLANEGARILEEGIAERALDIDMVKIHGYGYPRWRGGPMHTAEQLGKDTIKSILADVTAQSPDSWKIAEIYQ
ncbi:enoyl-CoA hydratase [Chromatiales bacterium (ex Bugula neritina AB1)]|nr:enoyl-CoA hydratase [Chromatiales bacterium (ex Bugula neritina AB1)]